MPGFLLMENNQQIDTAYYCAYNPDLFWADSRLFVHNKVVKEEMDGNYQQVENAGIGTVFIAAQVAKAKCRHQKEAHQQHKEEDI